MKKSETETERARLQFEEHDLIRQAGEAKEAFDSTRSRIEKRAFEIEVRLGAIELELNPQPDSPTVNHSHLIEE